jgi:cytochrome d ubiquinol oxidase subunit I
MGIIGTRSFSQDTPGISELEAEAESRISSGIIAYDALLEIRSQRDETTASAKADFEQHGGNLGYAYLLKRYVDDPREASEAQIIQAAADTIPAVGPLFWSFRLMVALGFTFIALMGYFFYRASFRRMQFPRPALWLAVLVIPAPWIAAELGWVVAESGRQPWTVDRELPTALSVSHLSISSVAFTLIGFVMFYSALFVIEMGLMLKYIAKGSTEANELALAWHKERNRNASDELQIFPDKPAPEPAT